MNVSSRDWLELAAEWLEETRLKRGQPLLNEGTLQEATLAALIGIGVSLRDVANTLARIESRVEPWRQ